MGYFFISGNDLRNNIFNKKSQKILQEKIFTLYLHSETATEPTSKPE